MDLKTFLTVVRTRWTTIVAVALTTILLAGLTALLTPRTYSSTTTLFVSVGALSTDVGDIVQGNSAAQAKMRSYVEVATSGRVLAPVLDEFDLAGSLGSLRSAVSVESPVNTTLIEITVHDADPTTAARLSAAVADSFTEVVEDDLEGGAGESGLVSVETLDEPVPATTPTSPRPALLITLGTITGLLLGIGVALLRNALDTRIRTEADVEGITGTTLLGTIGYHDDVRTCPLVVRNDPRSPLAEAFRTLRTNLQFLSFEAEGRSFVVTSAMPAEGKSTSAANLAIALAETGAAVLLVDADLRRPRVAELLGVEGAVGLSDLLVGRVELEDVVQPWGRDRLSVLPSGAVPPNPSELLGSRAMRSFLELVEHEYDYVVIDTPPVLPVTDAAVLSRIVSGTIVVTAAGRSSLHQLRRALDALSEIGSRTLGTVLTMAPRHSATAYGYTYGYAPLQDDQEPAPVGATGGGRRARRAATDLSADAGTTA